MAGFDGVLLLLVAVAGKTPVERWGALTVSGTQLVSSITHEEVQLVGVSLFASNTGWHGDKFWTQGVIDALAKWPGLSLVRAPMGVEEAGGYLEDPSNMDKLKTVIDAAVSAGVYIVVDWHSFMAELYLDDAKQFFREISTKYGQLPNLLFEIYNEPKPPDESGKRDWKALRGYSLALLRVIRQHSANPVIVGTPFFSQYLPDVARFPITEFKNVLYSLHFYASYAGHTILQTYLEQYGQTIPIFVSEWGSACPHYDCPVVPRRVDNWMALLDNHNVSWAHWALNDQANDKDHTLANTMSMLHPGADANGVWPESAWTTTGHFTRALIARHAQDSRAAAALAAFRPTFPQPPPESDSAADADLLVPTGVARRIDTPAPGAATGAYSGRRRGG